MKKIYETPEVKVIQMAINDVISTSGIGTGDDIGEGEDVACDAPGRRGLWD